MADLPAGDRQSLPQARPTVPRAIRERRLLTFRIADRLYALPGEEVSEIIRIPTVARVPHSPKCLLGLANLRGAVLPVVDLRSMVGCGTFAPSTAARAIVSTGSSPIVLAVDAVVALITIADSRLEMHQAELAAAPGERLRGAVPTADGETAKILDLAAMLAAVFSDRAAPARTTPALTTSTGGARSLARTATATANDEQLLLLFTIAEQDYALPLRAIREIAALPDTITVVPRAEAVLLGVISSIPSDIAPPGFATKSTAPRCNASNVAPARGG